MNTELPLWLDAVIAALVLAGAGFALVGSWGLAKFSDFYRRLHGPTKATTMGVGGMLLASALYFGWHGRWSLHELLIATFLFFTAPAAAQALVQAARAAKPRPPNED
jgi:multicomponent K+:H+ antiporter subunit G